MPDTLEAAHIEKGREREEEREALTFEGSSVGV